MWLVLHIGQHKPRDQLVQSSHITKAYKRAEPTQGYKGSHNQNLGLLISN